MTVHPAESIPMEPTENSAYELMLLLVEGYGIVIPHIDFSQLNSEIIAGSRLFEFHAYCCIERQLSLHIQLLYISSFVIPRFIILTVHTQQQISCYRLQSLGIVLLSENPQTFVVVSVEQFIRYNQAVLRNCCQPFERFELVGYMLHLLKAYIRQYLLPQLQ